MNFSIAISRIWMVYWHFGRCYFIGRMQPVSSRSILDRIRLEPLKTG